MAVDSGVVEQLEAQGIGAVRADQGMCALELAMGGSTESPAVGVVPLLWPVLFGHMGNEVPAFLSGYACQAGLEVATGQQVQAQCAAAATGFVASVAAIPGTAVHEAVETLVLRKVQEAAGVSVSQHAPLMESGVDSLAATELVGSLQRELGAAVKLPSSLVSFVQLSACVMNDWLCCRCLSIRPQPR